MEANNAKLREIDELINQADNTAKLPDGWKMYNKYQIRHTDVTPLKGKRYFVLRLDSDDPLEAARVAAAMSAYKGETPQGNAAKLREAAKAMLTFISNLEIEPYSALDEAASELRDKINAALAEPPRQCDVGTAKEQYIRFEDFCCEHYDAIRDICFRCPFSPPTCKFDWAQMPYKESEVSDGSN